MTTITLDGFWHECQAALPQALAGRDYRVRSFGSEPAMAQRLLALIVAGEKTGTFTVDWEFEDRPAERPRPGDLWVVTDLAGLPGALVRLKTVESLPFERIGPEQLACEGPGLRELELWRKVHWDYFTHRLAPLGRSPAMDMPVLWQRFELLRLS